MRCDQGHPCVLSLGIPPPNISSLRCICFVLEFLRMDVMQNCRVYLRSPINGHVKQA